MNKAYIIGEIGINHNGDIKIAKSLIDIAVIAGCDAVKFQKRTLPDIIPKAEKNKPKSTPWGEMTYLQYKQKIEFGANEYNEIDRYCKEKGIVWSASPWDIPSLEFLTKYMPPWIKISSACLTNHALVLAAAIWCYNFNKKLILSTGMSTPKEIDDIFKSISKECGGFVYNNLVLMHCNSTYPTLINELNLSCIETLKTQYSCLVGYSGHEQGIHTTVSSICFGAEYIERHITLDKHMWGSDQKSSIEPQDLIQLVKNVRELERAIGDGQIQLYDSEIPFREKLRII